MLGYDSTQRDSDLFKAVLRGVSLRGRMIAFRIMEGWKDISGTTEN